jgi:hypothetical protein
MEQEIPDVSLKENFAAGLLVSMGWMRDVFFDLVNNGKSFRIDVRRNPEAKTYRIKVTECAPDEQTQETE